MRMIVTGASGRLGRLVVAALLGRVPASEVILVSRSPGSLGDFARRGATVRYGDFERPDSLSAAFAGGQRALVISTIGVQDTPVEQGYSISPAVRRSRCVRSSASVDPRLVETLLHLDTLIYALGVLARRDDQALAVSPSWRPSTVSVDVPMREPRTDTATNT